jgi:hypothetical protein
MKMNGHSGRYNGIKYSINLNDKRIDNETLTIVSGISPGAWKKICDVISMAQEKELGGTLAVYEAGEQNRRLGRIEMAEAIKTFPKQAELLLHKKQNGNK